MADSSPKRVVTTGRERSRGSELDQSQLPGKVEMLIMHHNALRNAGFAWALLAGASWAAVRTEKITYQDGDQACQGVLAWDDAAGEKRPGVMIVHEWWGLDDYATSRAKQLAELGYVAFCADMYGAGKIAEHPQQAGEMAGLVRKNVAAWRQRAQAGLSVLKSRPECQSEKLAVIGYCFGGSTALQIAFGGGDVKAVVSFHGALPVPTAEEVRQTRAKILVCHGGADTFIPDSTIASFRGALDAGHAKYEFVSYPGVKHSFTVKSADSRGVPGLKYDQAADEDSWKRMLALFKTELGR